MNDPIRSDRPSTGDTADRAREVRIEELLLTGLEHYFTGQHELAINVWTRVLFLDRGHAKARAYIERARGAIAEKQREAEELLHSGAAALNRGDHAEARELLESAVEHGSSGEEALALLHRLERLEVAAEPSTRYIRPAFVPPPHRQDIDRVSGRRDARVAWVAGGLVTGVLIASVVGGYLWMVADSFELGTVRSSPPVVAEEPLPVPAACEMRLVRAERLFHEGRLREALAILDPGDPDGRHQARYDSLRGLLQRQLIDEGRRTAGFSTTDEPGSQRDATQTVARPPSRK